MNDGEKIVDTGLKKITSRYSDHIIEIVRLMLKFEESERPSFVELAKLVLTSTENSIDSPKNAGAGKKPIPTGKPGAKSSGGGPDKKESKQQLPNPSMPSANYTQG